jgi:uncharacterized protein
VTRVDKLSPNAPWPTATPAPDNTEASAQSLPPAPRLGWSALPQRVLIALVQAYRYLLKPWLGNACRFEPTCSQYALDALRQHGAWVGTGLTTGRLLRCQPWCQGGCDPVPQQKPALFSRLGLGQARPQHDSNDKEPSS